MAVDWRWARAVVTGPKHRAAGARGQDRLRCVLKPYGGAALIMAVCDGAGTARLGGQGASLTAYEMTRQAGRGWVNTHSLPCEQSIADYLQAVRDRLGHVAAARFSAVRDFAATLIFAMSDGATTTGAHVGDGAIVGRDRETGEWWLLSGPDGGEYAGTTYFVTDEDGPKLRTFSSDRPLSAIVAFTDGLERLALDLKTMRPHDPFFSGIVKPLDETDRAGLNAHLSSELRAFLTSDRISNRSDDDKAIVIAVACENDRSVPES
jgi:hypothetical protein